MAWRDARSLAANLGPVTIDPAWLRDDRFVRLAAELGQRIHDDHRPIVGALVMTWSWCAGAGAAPEYRGDRGPDDRVVPCDVLDLLWGRRDVLAHLTATKLAHSVWCGDGYAARLLIGPYYRRPDG